MQVRISPTLTANPILTLEDLGLERSVGLDQASRGLAERSEAQIVRWVQFPAGALFFTLVPEDPESGAVYVAEAALQRLRDRERGFRSRLFPARLSAAGPDHGKRPPALTQALAAESGSTSSGS